jgi:hypothetical protein
MFVMGRRSWEVLILVGVLLIGMFFVVRIGVERVDEGVAFDPPPGEDLEFLCSLGCNLLHSHGVIDSEELETCLQECQESPCFANCQVNEELCEAGIHHNPEACDVPDPEPGPHARRSYYSYCIAGCVFDEDKSPTLPTSSDDDTVAV